MCRVSVSWNALRSFACFPATQASPLACGQPAGGTKPGPFICPRPLALQFAAGDGLVALQEMGADEVYIPLGQVGGGPKVGLTGTLAGWLAGGLAGWLAGWLATSLATWLAINPSLPLILPPRLHVLHCCRCMRA